MSRTFIRQDTQIHATDQANFLDNLTVGSTLQTAAATVEDDLNALRSQARRALMADNAGNWYDDCLVPTYLDTGTKRGINNINTDLHAVERKRVLVGTANLTDVAVTAAQNWQVLTLGQLPSQTIAAIGSVTTIGTVAAYNATFGSHSLDLVAGTNALSPKNLCDIEDSTTHDVILSSGRIVYALFQTESNTNGSTMTGTTPNRAQLSFVRINTGGTALEAVPSADIAGKTIHYSSIQRKALLDLNEQDFLKGAVVDTPAAVTVTRQVAYDGQGTTPVELTTNATLDLNGAGIDWIIRDLANAALLTVHEGSAGGTTAITFGTDVDTLGSNAIVNTFNTGIRAAVGSQRIDIGVNTGIIESTGANSLTLMGAAKLRFDDSYQPGSTWVGTTGVPLADASAEWSLYKTNYGEVSLLNAINQAKNTAARGSKVYANVTVATVNAGTDVGGVAGGANLDAQLPNMSLGTFLTDYDVFLNGSLLRPGANVGAGHDYYPGTSLPNGQLMFTFKLKGGAVPDVLCVIPYA